VAVMVKPTVGFSLPHPATGACLVPAAESEATN
jgi:hypothetical protein